MRLCLEDKRKKMRRKRRKTRRRGRNGCLKEDRGLADISLGVWDLSAYPRPQAKCLSQRFWLFSVSSFHLLGWHGLWQGPELGCSPWQLLSSRWWRLTSVPAVCVDTWSLEALCLLQSAHVTLCQLPPPHSCLPICGLHRQLPRADHNHPASTPTDGYTSRLHLTCYLACELGCGDDLWTERKEMESDLGASEKTGSIILGGNRQSWSEMDFMGTRGISFSKYALFEDRFYNFRPYFSCLFLDGVLLCSSGWTRIHYVELAGLELSGLCSPSAGI